MKRTVVKIGDRFADRGAINGATVCLWHGGRELVAGDRVSVRVGKRRVMARVDHIATRPACRCGVCDPAWPDRVAVLRKGPGAHEVTA